MKDEIKEIITRMASYTIHYDCCSEGDAEEDIDKLLDYITNLQQQLDQLTNNWQRLDNYLQRMLKVSVGEYKKAIQDTIYIVNMLKELKDSDSE